MLERYAIDDGHHVPEIVISEDTSAAAGTARYAARCSCGHVSHSPDGSPEAALAAHCAHVNTRLGPTHVGLRTALLFVGCMAVWAAVLTGSVQLAHGLELSHTAIKVATACGTLLGAAGAFGLMVACRRFIAPTRA
ncbi:hypothetical protein ACH4PU_30240 [Streptomyces sp. NPDC021100]|uniref:hypothetical protein n=1 Tax=Streptomyces sp. NPDC021100 TaxID=3365114 RepID=UPI0037BA69C0